MNLPWFALVVKVGAIAGLFSVMLSATYGQSRVFYAMSRDGLLPALFARVHAERKTPHVGTLVLGGAIALAAGLLPITILSDMVTLGTALAFGIVCTSVIWLRNERPDIAEKALRGDAIPALLLGGYSVLGALIYWRYGLRHSKLAAAPVSVDGHELRQESV